MNGKLLDEIQNVLCKVGGVIGRLRSRAAALNDRKCVESILRLYEVEAHLSRVYKALKKEEKMPGNTVVINGGWKQFYVGDSQMDALMAWLEEHGQEEEPEIEHLAGAQEV